MKSSLKILAVVAALSLTAPVVHAQISIGISISARIAPPPLPVYEQPECPTDGYLWTPGYWAYDDDNGYYWVPAPGWPRRNPVIYGRPAIGVMMVASTVFTAGTGAAT